MGNIEVKILEKTLKPPFLLIKPEVTEKEFFEFANEDVPCELIDGMLMIPSPVSIAHERIFKLLLILFDHYLKKTSIFLDSKN